VVRVVAIAAFLAGLLLWVRVIFFGVRRVREDRLYHRKWPLALSAFLVVAGALLYARARLGPVTPGWAATVLLIAVLSAAGAWWIVQHSSTIPSTDPEDDPRYRFQGHVARVTEAIEGERGRLAFDFDGELFEFRARWSPAANLPQDHAAFGAPGSEVVIEVIEGDVAYVEPWSLVEERL
jgi:membrane protein implicated in regulation of membrane protease activity